MRFHVLGLPHTITTPEYTTCAFTMKVLKLCKMLTRQGHEVIHYGHQDSQVECTEHVTVVKRYDLDKSYKGHDWRTKGWPQYHNDDWAFKVFETRVLDALRATAVRGDFLLITFGGNQKSIADQMPPDVLVCEPGIGYPSGAFAPFQIFESYAVMHAYHTTAAISNSSNSFWYKAVIPNYFDLDDFTYRPKKDDYFLFLGRVDAGKGVHIAEQMAEKAGRRLVVAGGHVTHKFNYNKVENVGVVGVDQRRELLANATATLCPSMFLEPFCGVHVESMISGTPVITSDWGAFGEYNRHGVTGYRCKTFEQFEWAAKNIERIDPAACRAWGENFSIPNIAPYFEDYWHTAQDRLGVGWYEENPDRENLDFASWSPP